jgi:hypothetical protein
MSNQKATIVPRKRRDEVPPPAPLDPYVILLLRWVASHEQRLNPNTLAKQASIALDWPLPFAEAIVTATRARRLLSMLEVTARGGYGIGLTSRGRAWLDHDRSSRK